MHDTPKLITERLILRNFDKKDLMALYLLLKDEEVNTFLPWFPLKAPEEASAFYESRIKDKKYFFAICLKEDNYPIGYINADTDESRDVGYALCKEFWHRGIVTEAGKALVELLKKDKIPYITATHDVNNPRSGGVMRQIGMKYQYTYEERVRPENISVMFRLYQLNLDGNNERVYKKYWDVSNIHFTEPGL